MDIADGLYNYLVGQTSLTTLIATRLYPAVAPQGVALPYVVFQIVNTDHAFHLRGAAALAMNQFLFTINAATYASRQAVKEALRNILHGRGSTILSQTDASTINMKSAHLITHSDGYQDGGNGKDLGVFVQDMTFDITFLETVPTLP